MKSKQPHTATKTRHFFPDLPDIADIYNMAYKSLDQLPSKFQAHTSNVLVRVENFPDEETLHSLDIKDKYDLLGLYRGIPLPLKEAHEALLLPDIIFLYRGPLIRFARENGESLPILVNHVMVHEIGHHFGYSEFDVDWINTQSPEH